MIGRGLEILQTVSSGIQVPLAELTRQTGIPKPTARRIAEDLKRRGVLIRTPGGYRVGPALERVGLAAALQRKLPDAHDHLTDLHVHVGGIAWLGLLRPTDSTELRPIDLVTDAELQPPRLRVAGPHPPGHPDRNGGRTSGTRTAP